MALSANMSKTNNQAYNYEGESIDRDFVCFYEHTGNIPSYCLWSSNYNEIAKESNIQRISWWKQFTKHASEDVKQIANKWINILENNSLEIISWKDSKGYTEILPKFMGEHYQNLTKIFKEHLKRINPAFIFQYSYDVSHVPISIIKQIIGRDGYYFKMTTQNFNIDFIWYNKQSRKIEFFGYITNILEAYEFTHNRIERHLISIQA